MLTKHTVSKRARKDDTPIIGAHKRRYALLARKSFGTTRTINLNDLEALGLDGIILENISHSG